MDSFAQAELSLIELDEAIASGTIRPTENWPDRWAGLRLVQGSRDRAAPISAGSRTVVSEHAALISALLTRIWAATRDLFDHVDKIEFFARLGNVANDWHTRSDPSANPADLLRWLTQEARVMVRERREGTFSGFVLAPGDMAVADIIRALERGEQVGEVEMELYLTHVRSHDVGGDDGQNP